MKELAGMRPIWRLAALPVLLTVFAKAQTPEPQAVRRNYEAYQKLAVKRVLPETPPILEGAKFADRVRVEVIVNQQGDVVYARALEGGSLTCHVAVEAARRWKFMPTAIAGRPVRVVSVVEFNFGRFTPSGVRSEIDEAKAQLSQSPDSSRAHYNLGRVLQANARFEEAAEAYLKTISLASDWPVGWFGLAEVRWKQRRIEDALEACRTATQLKPDYFEALLMIGWAYGRLGRYEDASVAFAQAAQAANNSALADAAWSNLESAYKKLGRLEDAANALRQVVRYELEIERAGIIGQWPHVSAAALAEMYVQMGRLEDAIGAYLQAGEIRPLSDTSLSARFRAAELYLKTGRADEAENLHRSVLEMANASLASQRKVFFRNKKALGDAYFWQGRAYAALGMAKEAVAAFRKARKLEPYWAWPRFELADLYKRQGDLKAAEAELEEANKVYEQWDKLVPQLHGLRQ